MPHLCLERLNLFKKNNFDFFFVNQTTFQTFNLVFEMF